MNNQKLANVLLISAPSGTGKTTLIRALSQRELLRYSISHTTRLIRNGEEDGKDYHFVSLADFEALRLGGAFLEETFIHGNWYGTSWKNFLIPHQTEEWLILDVDVHGAKIIKQKIPDAVSIFILPPSVESLKERILHRQPTIDENELNKRLSIAKTEIRNALDYDYVVSNDNLDKATDELSFILRCEKLKGKRQLSLIESLCHE
jgi:guanylate kinase